MADRADGLAPAGRGTSKVSIIIIVTYLIGLGGFNHVIAGSTKVLFLVASGAESWSGFFNHFFIPTLLGNIAGGVSLVAFLDTRKWLRATTKSENQRARCVPLRNNHDGRICN